MAKKRGSNSWERLLGVQDFYGITYFPLVGGNFFGIGSYLRDFWRELDWVPFKLRLGKVIFSRVRLFFKEGRPF